MALASCTVPTVGQLVALEGTGALRTNSVGLLSIVSTLVGLKIVLEPKIV